VSELPATADAAVLRLTNSFDTPSLLTRLEGVIFEVRDLPGATLGYTLGNRIILDSLAAGHGWFVDQTPFDDSEFRRDVSKGPFPADSGIPASQRMDLLTAVMHELGHILGFGHDNDSDRLMSPILRLTERQVHLSRDILRSAPKITSVDQ